jgi:hypothetical protein
MRAMVPILPVPGSFTGHTDFGSGEMVELNRVEVDGRPLRGNERLDEAETTYAHFTAMQIRSGRVRGLELHMRRLESATRELFDEELDSDRVRA